MQKYEFGMNHNAGQRKFLQISDRFVLFAKPVIVDPAEDPG